MMSLAIKRSQSGDKKSIERELNHLLHGFDALHETTLVQLDRTDAALDRALDHFARSQGQVRSSLISTDLDRT
jgi:hypothetical protein